jgi:hypothetical protein
VWVCGTESDVLWVGAFDVLMFPYFLVEWSMYVMCVHSFGRGVDPHPPYFLSLVWLVENMALR